MAQIVTVQLEGIEDLVRRVDPRIVSLSNFRAVTRTRVTMAKVIRQRIRERYTVKASRITKDLKQGSRLARRLDRGNRAQLRLVYIGRRINLAGFALGRKKVKSRRGIRYAATTRVLRGSPRKIVRGTSRRGGFIGTRNGVRLVFERTGTVRSSPRYPGDEKLRSETGPAIAQMIRNLRIIREVQEIGIARYIEVMQQELRFRIGRATGRN